MTMFFDKVYLVSHTILMYYLLIVDRQSVVSFSSEMCLEKALTIQAILRQNKCPDRYLEAEPKRCSVLCQGTYTLKKVNNDCVGYNISFKLNGTLTSKLKDFHCKIKDCLVEVIDFECIFSEEGQINQQDINGRNGSLDMKENQKNDTGEGENESCNDLGTSIVISLSCLVGGGFIGISVFVLVKRIKTYKQIRLQPPPVFYQPNYGDGGDQSGDRTVTIASPLETEYADIEETIKMVAKAIQVPSYKEDSSSETRSRENIYHHLSLHEDSTKKENSDLVSTDSIPDSYADDVILSNKGSPSFKSVVICTESSSSKSNGNSKVSPTGSGGSDKYYALEKEYLIFNSSSNGNA